MVHSGGHLRALASPACLTFSSPVRQWASVTGGCRGRLSGRRGEMGSILFYPWAAQLNKSSTIGRRNPFVVSPRAANMTHTPAINKMCGKLAGPVCSCLQWVLTAYIERFLLISCCVLGIPELSPLIIHLDRALGIWRPIQMAQGPLSQGLALRKN